MELIKLSMGQERELLQNLQIAGLSEQDVQKVISSRGNQLARDIIALIQSSGQQLVEIIEIQVNYDDPAWQTIDRRRYAHVGDVTISDYPETEKGTKLVRFCEFFYDHDSTYEEIIAKAERAGCRPPTRVEAETYVRQLTPEQLQYRPVTGLIGPAVWRNDRFYQLVVRSRENGVRLRWDWAEGRWGKRAECRFVFVCK